MDAGEPDLPAPAADPSPSPSPSLDLRASDDDRERVADQLRRAAGDGRLTVDELDERLSDCYAARTIGRLAELTADIVPAPGAPASPAGAGPVVKPGPGGTGTIVSIMGGHDRKGRWRVAPRLNVVSVMGGADLDLTQAELAGPTTSISVFTLMGGCDLRVPDGVEVHISKFALMGGHDIKLSDAAPPPGAPVIRVRMLSIMGGAQVRQGRKLSKAERRLRKASERGELTGG